jgi:hypothetical protein
MLINRLIDQALGECDMTPSQIRAARLVLHKALPDIKVLKVEYEAAPSHVDAIRASYRPCSSVKLFDVRSGSSRSSISARCSVDLRV